MNCENYFCIYEEKGKCMLKDIELDVSGNCLSCIYVEIPEKLLQNLKSEIRNRLKSYK